MTITENACRPEFVSENAKETENDGPMLQIKGMRHPYAKPQTYSVIKFNMNNNTKT
jgi:hypothetical protein